MALVDQLATEDVRTRETAQKELRTAGVNRIPLLRKALASLTDAEARARLAEIVRLLLIDDADLRYAEGKLDEALLRLARVTQFGPWKK